MKNHDEARAWYQNPWMLGSLVFVVIVVGSCFADGLAPQVHAAEVRMQSYSLLTECGTLTRVDSTRADTTFGWIQYENGIRARPAFRFVSDTVEVGKKYEITYDPKHVVKTARAVKKCTAPAHKSVGASF